MTQEAVQNCRQRAAACRSNAEKSRNAFDEAAWLELADDWINLAEAFEAADRTKWN
jgi:hypothetical protein